MYHSASHCLCDKEAAPQVGIEDQVPIFPGDINRRFADIATGIVDEDIDVAESLPQPPPSA